MAQDFMEPNELYFPDEDSSCISLAEAITFKADWVIDRNHARCDGCGLVYETDDPYYFMGCQDCHDSGVFELEDDDDDDWMEYE